jgi:putative methyltransferase
MPVLNGCHFCAWGVSALNKIRQFPMQRVLEEITWMGMNSIEYVEGCDANFGILPRDVQIAEHLAKTKEKYGFPQKYRAAFAKYSNKRIMDQVFSVASILNKSGQLKAVTLALQSTNDDVLVNIDRKNISMSGFQELQERYKKDGIPTYIELIMGLPGETYSTFKAGIDKILNAGGHEGLSIYQCVILPNSEMGNPEYIKKHGLQSVPMRAMLLHGTPNKECPDEIQETIIATNSMPHEDWKKTWFLSWALQTFHSTHLTQWWAKEQSAIGTPYSCFYERLIRTAEQWPESVLGRVYAHTSTLLEAAIQGGSWDNVLPGFGDISWPPDEGAFLMVAKELHLFYSQMKLLKDMPVQQWEYGPPEIPQGKEEAYGKVFWYSRKGDLIGSLRKFVGESKEESKEETLDVI